jgi:nicotinamide-nucleotide amidase
LDELTTLAERIGAKLKARKETVVVAESTAGGLVCAALLGVAGASAYYLGGMVVYNARGRELLLGEPSTDSNIVADREQWTLAMARDMRARFGATWALGESGSAGPTGLAPGRTCTALAGPSEVVTTIETGSADRRANMTAFAVATLRLLDEATA